MMSPPNEVGQPCAPLNGVYYRMEDDDVQKRFNNGFRMEILNDVAHVEKGKGKRRKSYICKLQRYTSFIFYYQGESQSMQQSTR